MTEPLAIEALESLALDFRRVAQSSTIVRRRGWRRPVFAVPLATLAIAGSAAAGALLVSEGEPIKPAPIADFSAEQQPLPQTARVGGVQTSDPAGGPPWALMTYRNAGGQTCLIPGRLVNGKVGVLASGVFHELPLRGPGQCVTLRDGQPLSMTLTRSRDLGDATVVYGIAGRRVAHITFTTPGGPVTVVPDPDGLYLAVFSDDGPTRRIVTLTDGSTLDLTPPAAATEGG